MDDKKKLSENRNSNSLSYFLSSISCYFYERRMMLLIKLVTHSQDNLPPFTHGVLIKELNIRLIVVCFVSNQVFTFGKDYFLDSICSDSCDISFHFLLLVIIVLA